MHVRLACLLFLFAVFAEANPALIDNDAGCDISNLPAATLLLPYFEVHAAATPGLGETTIFTVTNVSHLPQIARVTLWTDLAYPVISFNVFLTGYDVQSINLYDLFTRGHVSDEVPKRGRLSATDNPLADEQSCADLAPLDDAAMARLRQVFTTGDAGAGCTAVGTHHAHLVGYATVDVVGSCGTAMPTDPGYFAEDIRFDNVLIGDYLQVNGREDFAQGGTMVHIRAIPEGGHPRDRKGRVTLPRTFYGQFQSRAQPQLDARQPLPNVFGARWIDGGPTGFETQYKVWREGIYWWNCRNYRENGDIPFLQIVRFDEEENPTTIVDDCPVTCLDRGPSILPAELVHVASQEVFPYNPDSAPAGWMYFNLASAPSGSFASNQAWVTSSMRAEDRYSVDIEAQALGNGCSFIQSVSDERQNPIGPLPNLGDNVASCDIAALPAATLLLPYFEVDVEDGGNDANAIFTVTNASQVPQVARVTLWTDLAFPVFAFNIYLTGYDVQSINLYDVIGRGVIAPDTGTGSAISPVGYLSGTSATAEYDNPLLDESSCASAGPVAVTTSLIQRMRFAFAEGRLPGGSTPGCDVVGGVHANAAGYATIDVIGSCSTSLPTDPAYFAEDIRFDNVLLGDYIQLYGLDEGLAQGNPMVHIRALPEGGHPRVRRGDPELATNFPSTFYGAYQPAHRPLADARQPLPSVFAARWIEGGPAGFETFYKIWRETPREVTSCADARANNMPYTEVVRFDEDENPQAHELGCPFECIDLAPRLRPTNLVNTADASHFPYPAEDFAGWMYINLDDPSTGEKAAQAWVITSMRAEGRFSIDVTASALGNGCSAPIGDAQSRGPIGPLPNQRN